MYPLLTVFLFLFTLTTFTQSTETCQPGDPNQTFPPSHHLPNPFLFINGTPITTTSSWSCRRAELSFLLQTHLYGPQAPKPDSNSPYMSALTRIHNLFTITLSSGSRSIYFNATYHRPFGISDSAPGPFPVMIHFGPESELPDDYWVNQRHLAQIYFQPEMVATTSVDNPQGVFYDLYPELRYKTSATMAWAWAVSRIIDAIEELGDGAWFMDAKKVGIVGCTGRYGRAALLAGALDERIVLTIPIDSGTGGAGCWKIADEVAPGNGVHPSPFNGVVTAKSILYFGDRNSGLDERSMAKWAGREGENGWDMHALMGMVAPRGLLVLESESFVDDGRGDVTAICALAGKKVYEAVGRGEGMGFVQSSRPLCKLGERDVEVLDRFVQRFLRGNASEMGETDLWLPLENVGVWPAPRSWIDWELPILL